MSIDPTRFREVRTTWHPIKDLSEEWGISIRSIRRAMEQGKLEAWFIDGRYLIRPESFTAWLESDHIVPVESTTG